MTKPKGEEGKWSRMDGYEGGRGGEDRSVSLPDENTQTTVYEADRQTEHINYDGGRDEHLHSIATMSCGQTSC